MSSSRPLKTFEKEILLEITPLKTGFFFSILHQSTTGRFLKEPTSFSQSLWRLDLQTEEFREKTSRKQSGKHKQIYMNTSVTRMWINSILFYIQRLKRLHKENETEQHKNDNLTGNPESGGNSPVEKPPPARPGPLTAPFPRHKHTRTISKDSRGKGKVSAAIPAAPKGLIFPAPNVSTGSESAELGQARSFPNLWSTSQAQLIFQVWWLLPIFTTRWNLHDQSWRCLVTKY